jgi:proteic killer suppression protein
MQFNVKMIKCFKHKGLKLFFTKGSTRLINVQHAPKIELQLQALHTATAVSDMNVPGWEFHELTGDRQNTYSISVSGNWRITFEFEDGHAYIVNYEDYH